MQTHIIVDDFRHRLEKTGWKITELGCGPWIVYGFHGDEYFCVMSLARLNAWEKAIKAAHAALKPNGGSQ